MTITLIAYLSSPTLRLVSYSHNEFKPSVKDVDLIRKHGTLKDHEFQMSLKFGKLVLTRMGHRAAIDLDYTSC